MSIGGRGWKVRSYRREGMGRRGCRVVFARVKRVERRWGFEGMVVVMKR